MTTPAVRYLTSDCATPACGWAAGAERSRAGAERMQTRASAASNTFIMGFLTIRIAVSELMRKQRPGMGRRLPVGLAPYALYTGGVASDRLSTRSQRNQ